jgi:predicted methyltransferase
VKYANELVLMAKEVIVLQGMLERLTEFVRRYGIERNVEEIKVVKISRQNPPSTDYGKAVFDNKENFAPTNWTYILGRN